MAKGRDQPVAPKARDKSLGVPVAKGGVVDQALADGGPAGGLDKVGLQRSPLGSNQWRLQWLTLVDEDQPFQHVGQVRLKGFDPGPAPLGHVGPQDFAGQQRFFYG